MGIFDCHRRKTSEVKIGGICIGGNNPIAVQSMTSTSTMDTDGSVAQIKRIADAGAELVRLTAQGVREAANLSVIKSSLRSGGYGIPLVADIHFNPNAAFEAAKHVEKVRINPGNFIDPGRTFKNISYTDDEYNAELKRLEDKLVPFLRLCDSNRTAIRIGVNHGSLSDRIMSRYGDTPEGMVESAMEFLRICKKENFNNVVISIKASNTVVTTSTVRLLCQEMAEENMDYPLHLGVTEAGNGEDGRIKSAIGIGSLLASGIGDTIRVSLSEEPENEIPVALSLLAHIDKLRTAPQIPGSHYAGFNRIYPQTRKSRKIANVGGGAPAVAIGTDTIDFNNLLEVSADDPIESIITSALENSGKILVVSTAHRNPSAKILSVFHRLVDAGVSNPLIPKISYSNLKAEELAIAASVDFGSILLSGFHDGIFIDAPGHETGGLSLSILQGCRVRFSHTEYIACPGCGRTLFDLQTTLAKVKKATSHLPELKIGVMGCIVNGPGEMADADYGYVGASAGHISLYRGKECIKKNIPEDEAIEHLVGILKNDGKWHDPITD